MTPERGQERSICVSMRNPENHLFSVSRACIWMTLWEMVSHLFFPDILTTSPRPCHPEFHCKHFETFSRMEKQEAGIFMKTDTTIMVEDGGEQRQICNCIVNKRLVLWKIRWSWSPYCIYSYFSPFVSLTLRTLGHLFKSSNSPMVYWLRDSRSLSAVPD